MCFHLYKSSFGGQGTKNVYSLCRFHSCVEPCDIIFFTLSFVFQIEACQAVTVRTSSTFDNWCISEQFTKQIKSTFCIL